MSDKTNARRPFPPRPSTGLLAWQATVGHISTRISPDAMLKLQVSSREARVIWSAMLSWGQKQEVVEEQPSLAAALHCLWDEVRRHHTIFERPEDTLKSPSNYTDAEWLDLNTQESLQRLIWVTQSAFPGDWRIVVIYQPIEIPEGRVQARLLARENTIVVGGRGPSLLEACRALFRNATPYYAGGTSLQRHL
jgi:hypothetical protein